MAEPSVPSSDARRPLLFLHAGLHKTGTTFLQSLFAANRGTLEQHGIVFPVDPDPVQTGHHSLAVALKKNCRDDNPSLDWLRGLDAERRHVFLSSEGFSPLSQAALEQIAAAVPSRTVVPILVLREWSGLLYSVWNQVLSSRNQSLPEYLTGVLLDPMVEHFVNFHLTLDRFAGAFGRESLHVISYDNALRDEQRIVDLILGKVVRTDLREADLDASAVASNPRRTPEEAALLRLSRFLLGESAEPQRSKQLLRKRREDLLELVPELKTLGDYRRRYAIVKTSSIFETLNRSVFASYGDRVLNAADGRIFAEIGSSKLDHICLDEWTARNPAAVISLSAHLTEMSEHLQGDNARIRREKRAAAAAALSEQSKAVRKKPARATTEGPRSDSKARVATTEGPRPDSRARGGTTKSARPDSKAQRRKKSLLARLLGRVLPRRRNKPTPDAAKSAARKARRAERKAAAGAAGPPRA